MSPCNGEGNLNLRQDLGKILSRKSICCKKQCLLDQVPRLFSLKCLSYVFSNSIEYINFVLLFSVPFKNDDGFLLSSFSRENRYVFITATFDCLTLLFYFKKCFYFPTLKVQLYFFWFNSLGFRCPIFHMALVSW